MQDFCDTAHCHRASSSQHLERTHCLGNNQSNSFRPEQNISVDLQNTLTIDVCSAK